MSISKKSYRYSKVKDKKEGFDSKLLDLARVTRVSAGGKRLRFRAVIALGDKKGHVGLGVAKGLDVTQAIEKSTRLAKKNIITVPLYNGTIFCETKGHFGASDVILKPQRKGRGVVAGGIIRIICRLAGIEDISSKIIGRTRNRLNNAKATIKALKNLQKYVPKK